MGSLTEKKVPLMSAEMRDAAIAEVLGDVHMMHNSVKDLARIVVDTDERITARVVELRVVSREFAAQREAAFAAISVRARETSQLAFKEELSVSLSQFESRFSDLPNALDAAASRRFGELVMVGLASGALSCLGSLLGFWMMVH